MTVFCFVNSRRWPRLSCLTIIVLVLLQSAIGSAFDEERQSTVSVESFVNALDKDGDGEIGPEEAQKLWTEVMEHEAAFEEEDLLEAGVSMSDLVVDHNLDTPFSYGGSTISSAELTEHLSHMLTGERVVAWVIHGLRLPQYAEAFQKNAIDGLDFPTLISDNGSILKEDLGVSSALHRHKIHTAIFRQIFGLGQTPGKPRHLECHSSTCDSISLQWDPPSSLGVPPLHKYHVQRRISSRFASWVDVGDSQDDALLDDSPALIPGQKYAYRVQAWCAHGPSDWIVVDGCLCGESVSQVCFKEEDTSDGFAFGQQVALQTGEEIEGSSRRKRHQENPRKRLNDSFSVKNISLDGNESSLSSTDQNRGGTVTTFTSVFFFNTALLLLGFAVRHSAFFRVILVAYSVGLRAVQKLLHALAQTCLYVAGFTREAQSLCGRLVTGRNPLSEHSALLAHSTSSSTSSSRSTNAGSFESLAVLSRSSKHVTGVASVVPGEVPGTIAVSGANGVVTIADGTVRTMSGRAMSLHDLLSPNIQRLPSSERTSHSPNGKIESQSSIHGFIENSQFQEGIPYVALDGLYDGVLRPSNKRSSGSEAGLDGATSESSHGSIREEATVSTPNEAEDDELQSVSAKHRCHAEGCRTRFDRWYTVQGLRERMHKHYCRDCQGVYCEKHTRISPHSARSQCGLDSQCLCHNCFSRLPADHQLRAEKLNKLRPGLKTSKGAVSSGALMFRGSGSNSGGSRESSSARDGWNIKVPPSGSSGKTSSSQVTIEQGSSGCNIVATAIATDHNASHTERPSKKAVGYVAPPFPKLSGLLSRKHHDKDSPESVSMRKVVSERTWPEGVIGNTQTLPEWTGSKTDAKKAHNELKSNLLSVDERTIEKTADRNIPAEPFDDNSELTDRNSSSDNLEDLKHHEESSFLPLTVADSVNEFKAIGVETTAPQHRRTSSASPKTSGAELGKTQALPSFRGLSLTPNRLEQSPNNSPRNILGSFKRSRSQRVTTASLQGL